MIQVKELTLSYDDTIILQNINFSVKAGSIFAILGSSGGGKTTLFKSLVGLLPPKQGTIFIKNHDIYHSNFYLENTIGVLFQNNALFHHLTLLENIRILLEYHHNISRQLSSYIALMKLSLVGLQDYAYYYPQQISGGMQKRAALARALALDPNILF